MASLTAPRQKLLLIVALFLLPLLAATLWYRLLPQGYRPDSTTNHGTLILPVYPLQDVGKDLERRWTLVYLLERGCNAACSKTLYNTRQLRIALNKDIDRLKRITIATPAALAATDARMWASHPDMTILGSAGTGNTLDTQIRAYTATQQYPADSVYLIDPLGNLMMQFSPELEPKLMLEDIRKLLRLSHIG